MHDQNSSIHAGSGLFRGISGWLSSTLRAEDGSPTMATLLAWIRERFSGPAGRALRYVFITSIVVQLFLAPLTSWASDTPSFVGSVVALLYRGSPYATDQLFNPPLGSFLQAPFFALLSIWNPPSALVTNVAAIAPAASVSGVSTQIPTAPALIALKLPLIIACILTGLCVTYLGELTVGRSRSVWVAGSWLLNPLVIWSTAVHGEVDVLACAAVLAFLIALLQRWYFVAGVALALGMVSKAYPIILLPCSLIAINYRNRGSSESPSSAVTVRFAVGVGLTLLPFAVFLPNLESIQGGLSTVSYGGFNLLLLFNPGEYPKNWHFFSGIFTPALANLVHVAFAGVFVASIVASLLLAWVATYVDDPPIGKAPTKTLVYMLVWPLAAVLLYQTSPQSENLLLVLAALLVLGCLGGSLVKTLYWVLSGAGMALYLTLASPVAFFYPLAVSLGGGWIPGMNSVVVSYASNAVIRPRAFWMVSGLIGAGCIITVCILSGVYVAKLALDRAKASRSAQPPK